MYRHDSNRSQSGLGVNRENFAATLTAVPNRLKQPSDRRVKKLVTHFYEVRAQ